MYARNMVKEAGYTMVAKTWIKISPDIAAKRSTLSPKEGY
jgi:hypothetical protein